jgi:hypothetical protein
MSFVMSRRSRGVSDYSQQMNDLDWDLGASSPILIPVRIFWPAAGINRMAYWSRPSGSMLYIWGWSDVLRAYRFEDGKFKTKPESMSDVPATFPRGVMTVSADGGREGTGIVWATTTVQSSLRGTVRGTLRAFDAANVSRELWNSDQSADRDYLGNLAKFSPPIVANGKVYVPTFSNRLVVYGLY